MKPSDQSDPSFNPPIEPEADSNLQLGLPGYRTRPGRSGLDYVETNAELGHMEGLFFRRLITFQLQTENPLYLGLMLLFGLGALVPLLLILGEMITGNFENLLLIVAFLPLALFGVALFINFFKNFTRR